MNSQAHAYLKMQTEEAVREKILRTASRLGGLYRHFGNGGNPACSDGDLISKDLHGHEIHLAWVKIEPHDPGYKIILEGCELGMTRSEINEFLQALEN